MASFLVVKYVTFYQINIFSETIRSQKLLRKYVTTAYYFLKPKEDIIGRVSVWFKYQTSFKHLWFKCSISLTIVFYIIFNICIASAFESLINLNILRVTLPCGMLFLRHQIFTHWSRQFFLTYHQRVSQTNYQFFLILTTKWIYKNLLRTMSNKNAS